MKAQLIKKRGKDAFISIQHTTTESSVLLLSC